MQVRAGALPSLPAATHGCLVPGLHRETGRDEGVGKLGAIKTLSMFYKDYHIIHIAVYCEQKERKIRKKGKKEKKREEKPNQS